MNPQKSWNLAKPTRQCMKNTHGMKACIRQLTMIGFIYILASWGWYVNKILVPLWSGIIGNNVIGIDNQRVEYSLNRER